MCEIRVQDYKMLFRQKGKEVRLAPQVPLAPLKTMIALFFATF